MKSILLAIVFIFLWLSASAYAVPIPDTGQGKCYNSTQEIACPQPGAPFYGQDSQYGPNVQSYTKLDTDGVALPDNATEWIMVRDNVTGLVWEIKTDDGSIHDKDNQYSWQRAADEFIPALNTSYFGGHDDWRLPAIKELSWITDRGRIDPTINTSYFPYVSLYYWSSTPDNSGERGPFYVQIQTGYEYNFIKEGDGAMGVRGDVFGMTNDLIDNGDGTVTDNATGLMWQQAGPAQKMNWEQSLAYCENLYLAGHADWRLPNINELQSIVDYTRHNPSIDTDYFPATAADCYRTSTTIPGSNSSKAWVIDFGFGYVDYYFASDKSGLLYVRAVRGGALRNSDADGVYDDGDNSSISGDNPCAGGAIDDCDDNCIYTPNGPSRGTCVRPAGGVMIGTGAPCDGSSPCPQGQTCQMGQEDMNSNGIGDACECYADFNQDGKVILSDLVILKTEFGRTDCAINPCQSDANDDNKVILSDLVILKTQFGKTGCPVP